MFRKVIIALSLVLLGGILYIFNNRNPDTPPGIEIDNYRYPILGIDLSEYSGKVNFSALKNEVDIHFVYLRTSAGQDYKDKNFEENYKHAVENKYLVGFYHYYRFNEDPINQAKFFMHQIEGKNQKLPLVIDVEDWGNKSGGKSISKISKEINLFINFIKENTQADVMIYTNESGHKTYIEDKINDTYIWICTFKQVKSLNINWLFWQYSHKGKYKAIEGWVDLNTFNGDEKEWEAFIKE